MSRHITDGLYKMQGERFSPAEPHEICHSCNRPFYPTSANVATTRGRGEIYLCSDECFEDWLQFGRWER